MSEEVKQPVVEKTEAEVKPAVEGTGARNDDLESLLSQYEQETKVETKTTPTTPTQPDLAALAKEVSTLQGAVKEVENFEFRRDMDGMIKDVRGDLDPEIFDNSMVEAWLDAQARQDPRLQKAWLQRDANPKQFQRITAELGKKLAEKFAKLPDAAATEDRAAVTAAVRGTATKAPAEPPPNYARSSNVDFRKEVMEKYGYDPGV